MTTNPSADLREQFLLQPDIVFLNHGSFGACPRPVFEAYQARQLELEREPVKFFQRLNDLLTEARGVLGPFVGADPDDLAFVTNATMGINVVARSLRLEPGDEVLTTNHEYGSCNKAWQYYCESHGARYLAQDVPLPVKSAEQVIEAIWAGVTEHTRVLFLSHITSPTALTLPIEPLIRRAREAGIITVIDGAHAPGQRDLDLEALGVDFYATSLHKWMMAPKGAGFLYARREMQHLLEPLIVGGAWRNDGVTGSHYVAEQKGLGTRDAAAFLAVPEAIRFYHTHNWPAVRTECHMLVRHFRNTVTRLTGLEPICPDGAEWFAQMATVPLPECDAAELGERAFHEFAIEVPFLTWEDRQYVRLSVHGYNTREDVGMLIGALTELLGDRG